MAALHMHAVCMRFLHVTTHTCDPDLKTCAQKRKFSIIEVFLFYDRLGKVSFYQLRRVGVRIL